jgi:hypothetical protein
LVEMDQITVAEFTFEAFAPCGIIAASASSAR